MKYAFPVPRSRGFSQNVSTQVIDWSNPKAIRDMFLYALFARVAANDDETHEFKTNYNNETQHIELEIPDDFLQIVENTTKGDNFRRYIAWLIDQSQFWSVFNEDENILSTLYKVCFNSVGYCELINNGSSGSSAIIDWSAGNKQRIILTDNCTLQFLDPPYTTSLQLIVDQDSIGGRTINWPASVLSRGGIPIAPTSAPNSKDVMSFLFDGVNYLQTKAADFK